MDIPDVVKKYELSGGSIINAVHSASLKAVERKRNTGYANKEVRLGEASLLGKEKSPSQAPLIISLTDVMQGIKKELTKEGKPFVG